MTAYPWSSWFGIPLEPKIDISLLLIRSLLGVAFLGHGSRKIANPMRWLAAPHRMPGVWQAVGAFTQFFGGIFLLLGFLTPLAAFSILVNMIVGYLVVYFPDRAPYIAKPGERSWEITGAYAVVALALLVSGPGRWSIDALMAPHLFG